VVAPPPAIRLKSHWFRSDKPKTPEENAGAMGFIAWRVARQMIGRMRSADFDVDIGEPYFAFLREALVFLVAVVDRIAHVRMDAQARQRFTTALVLKVADYVQENEGEYLAPAAPGAYAERFIDLFNEVQAHYAEFGADAATTAHDGFTPDFAFVRYLGHRLEPVLPAKDRRWVVDQVMAVEAPDAVATLQSAMRDLHDAAPRTRRRRASVTGD
jgi:hypothetical protein